MGYGALPQPDDRQSPQRPSRNVAAVIAVTGLKAEARIASGLGVQVVSGGGDRRRLEATLDGLVGKVDAVLSFGIAGGLAPGLMPGDCLVARDVLTQTGQRFSSDRRWAQRLSVRLGGAPIVDITGVDEAVIDAAGKRTLHVTTASAAVDMESHIAARFAADHDLPFAAIRVIADPAERSLPRAAQVGMKPDGGMDALAVLRSLGRNPRQIPTLLRTALDARAAFASLFGCRQMLAGGLDFGELMLDVAAEDVLGRSLPV